MLFIIHFKSLTVQSINSIYLADGKPKDFEVFDGTGVNIIYNQSLDKNPKGGEWKEELPCMYSRVLIPEIFGDVFEKSLYLDADILSLMISLN